MARRSSPQTAARHSPGTWPWVGAKTTRGVDVNADGKEKVPIAFFRAPSPVVSVSCAGDKIAVGCESGAVLTLHAAWLTDGGAA